MPVPVLEPSTPVGVAGKAFTVAVPVETVCVVAPVEVADIFPDAALMAALDNLA